MTIGLVMIVKNEEHVIERSLKSALPFVDTWCIVDTGSTDSTMEKIQKIADECGVKGELHQRPWVNFGVNRTELLEVSRKKAEWSLMMDADDILHLTNKPSLTQTTDAYTIKIHRGTLVYYRPILFNNARPWKFTGAVHEYAECPGVVVQTPLSSAWLDARCEGARSKNPKKYQIDAESLEDELTRCPGDTRSMFYAAQSWRDAGVSDKAAFWYLKRSQSGGWNQEQYVSLLNLIRLTNDIQEKLKYAWQALDICPRLEVAYEILKTAREKNQWTQQVYALGIVANTFSRIPSESYLFVEQLIYDYQFDDEFSIHCYYLKKDEESSRAAFRALKKAPPAHQERIRANYEFALKRLS